MAETRPLFQWPAPEGKGAAEPARANQLDKIGSRKRVLRVWQSAYLSGIGRHVEYMQFGRTDLRPLIWLHSVEYPAAPPWGLCVDAAEKGFSIVSVRRPGFGGTSSVADTDEEVRLLTAFLDEAGFENAVMIVEGTARPAGIRLAMTSPRIAFTVLARPAYSSETFGEIDAYLRDLILQTMQSGAGARLSLAAMQQLGRGGGHRKLYQHFLKVPSDTDHIRNHERDLDEAWACFTAIKADTFRREMHALIPDPSLTDGALANLRGIAVIGSDTPSVWRDGFEAKSARLGIRTAVLPGGSLFALYLNGERLLDLVAEHAG